MPRFKELYIRGNDENLRNFHDTIAGTINRNWSFRRDSFLEREFLFFRYSGDELHPAAEVSLTLKNNGCYYIPNIVPIEKQELSVEEYNNMVDFFKQDIVDPYVTAQPTDIEVEVQ